LRGAIYVDGFNLYHAIDDLNQPYLKWLNLRKLGELVARGHSKSIVRAVFCTAYFPGDHGKRSRHRQYVEALNLVGVETLFGHTTKEPMECALKTCGYKWDAPREKETDINLALSLYADAVTDVFDVGFLVTADTDQAATLNFMSREFPNKRIIVAVPPGRTPSKHLRDLSSATMNLTIDHLDECALPSLVESPGRRSVVRPFEYDPPAGWVHPDDRPKKSKG
jgi:hypothetical protein